MKENKTGIYRILNTINNKTYIGKTNNINKRFKEHLWVANKKILSYPLHNDLRKYGKDNFKFEVLEYCSDKQLNNKEKVFIEIFNTLYPNGYNLNFGVSPSKITKDKMKESSKTKKEVIQYDLNGNFIKEFSSSCEAGRVVFGDRNKQNIINKVCLGKLKTAHGYIWTFKGQPIRKESLERIKIKERNEISKKYNTTLRKERKVMIISPTPKKVVKVFNNLNEVSGYLGINFNTAKRILINKKSITARQNILYEGYTLKRNDGK